MVTHSLYWEIKCVHNPWVMAGWRKYEVREDVSHYSQCTTGFEGRSTGIPIVELICIFTRISLHALIWQENPARIFKLTLDKLVTLCQQYASDSRVRLMVFLTIFKTYTLLNCKKRCTIYRGSSRVALT